MRDVCYQNFQFRITMSDETLDEIFRNAAEKLEVEFELSSWDKLKGSLDKTEILEVSQKSGMPFFNTKN